MKPQTERRGQTAAERRRSAVARERVARHMGGMLDGLDPETRIETCRAAIRELARVVKAEGGEGRSAGVLCGALVDVAPTYRREPGAHAAAHALFRRPEEEA